MSDFILGCIVVVGIAIGLWLLLMGHLSSPRRTHRDWGDE